MIPHKPEVTGWPKAELIRQRPNNMAARLTRKTFEVNKGKQRLLKIFELIDEVYEQATKRISTSLFNKVILEAYTLNPPIIEKNKRLRIYYATQVGVEPPEFVIFVNDSTIVKPSYKRYLEKKLREAFGFNGVPFRVFFKNRKEKEKNR